MALYKAITAPTVDSNLVANLPGLLGNSNSVSNVSTQGLKILDFLFNDKAATLGNQIANIADAPATGTKSLLALAAPVLFGFLKNQISSQKMSPNAFISMLSTQTKYLERSMPERVLQWLGWGSSAGFLGGLGQKFSGALNGLSNVFEPNFGSNTAATAPQSNQAKTSGFWKWLLPLALLALIAILMKSCQKPELPPAPAVPEVTTPVVVAPVAANDTLLSLSFNGDKALVDATVATDAEKADLLKQLDVAYGKGAYTANIKVDANTKPAAWLLHAADLFTLTKIPGAELNIKGTDVHLSGALANPKFGLLDKIKALLAGLNVTAVAFSTDSAIASANSKFAEAIKALFASNTCSADALVSALNLYVVNFSSGSAAIPTSDVAVLKSTAPLLATCAKEGVKVEIGGHTDNVGDANANMHLSAARANEVKALLVHAGVPAATISTKGYGDSTPVGNNNTEAGRFENRRISYTKQ